MLSRDAHREAELLLSSLILSHSFLGVLVVLCCGILISDIGCLALRFGR